MFSDGIRVAESQTSTTLVSNLAETSDSAGLSAGSDTGTAVSQGFGTGGNAGGYLLTGVSVVIYENNFSGADTATYKIYDSEADGTPRNEIYTLTTPSALTVGSTVFFAAPSGATLEPNKKYHVVFQGTGDPHNNNLDLETTASDAQTGESGWSIENAFRATESLDSGGLSAKISIQGVVNSAATGVPTISGDAIVGRTLTADTTAIMDADGLSNVSFSYQ